MPGPDQPRRSPAEFEHAVSEALLRIWWVPLLGKLFIGGVIAVLLALVGVGYIGQTQIASMLDTREKISSAGESIMVQVQNVRDAAEKALPQIARDGQSIRHDAEEASRIFNTLSGLEADLRAKKAELDALLGSAKPLTPGTLWSMSDKMLKGIILILGLCLGVLLLDLVLRLIVTIRRLPD